MHPSPNWESARSQYGGKEYHFVDSNLDATVWKEHGQWHLSFSLDAGAPLVHTDLGRTWSVNKALCRAEMVIEDGYRQVTQSYEDLRTVVALANEIEDVTPAERAAIDRLDKQVQDAPPRWLEEFEHDIEPGTDDDEGYGY